MDEFVIAEILLEFIRREYDNDRMLVYMESCGYVDADARSYLTIGITAQQQIDMIAQRTGIVLDNSWISYKADILEKDN